MIVRREVVVTVRLSPPETTKADQLRETMGFTSRSEVLRYALDRLHLAELKNIDAARTARV